MNAKTHVQKFVELHSFFLYYLSFPHIKYAVFSSTARTWHLRSERAEKVFKFYGRMKAKSVHNLGTDILTLSEYSTLF